VIELRIAICEDDSEQASNLKCLIDQWANKKEIIVADIRIYESAEQFLYYWQDLIFDLAILDIQMKRMSGLELAAEIRKTDKLISIVFLSGFTQYILRGYDVDALNYLIKPVKPAKLFSVLDKAYALWNARKKDKIIVSDSKGIHAISIGSITYITMSSHMAEIHTDSGVYLLRKTADEFEQELPSCFERCHRSVIVNMHRVEYILAETLGVDGGDTLPISRKRRKSVSESFLRLNRE